MRACLMVLLSLVISLALEAQPGLAQATEELTDAPPPPGSALVIDNAAYASGGLPSAPALSSAQSLARELTRIGFNVGIAANLRQNAMRGAINAFTGTIKPGSAALFFFSGYGVEAKGTTYLIPIDANIWTEADVRDQGISVDAILAAMDKAGAKVKIMILDASRRNPFERRFRSLSGGLGAIDPPPQTLLLSSAEPGKVVDGDSNMFIGELLKELRSPDARADDVFNHTRLGVARATSNQQTPVVKSTLTEPFFLKSGSGTPDLPADAKADAGAVQLGPPQDAKPGAVFRDCAACPELVIVPAGDFAMGSQDFAAEQPVHSVTIGRPFAIGRVEVTFAQWDACIADGGCAGWRPDDRGRDHNDGPVGEVSWSDAHRFLDWLSRKSGHPYRLPSEAEWEYAARAGALTRFWWGDEAGSGHANCRGCGGAGLPSPAGSYTANAFGLFDTAGNIAEWVEDCWSENYEGAPRDGGVAHDGPCKQRVVRGGSFDAGPRYVRSASRFLYDAELRYYTNGFRVVRDLP
ncbi:conserved exported protein of unknown function [Methylocella tundrae]|uniref:Caspase family p20 domain-containing protein n=2 Tax=Methylocella tundrae TaxID=227605 RepID=A0A4U8Z3M1_METTU|nr:SUMF1/EgtB/PvdO family nonheme iron enzyme [Methylocella tundrae]VFU10024.1 conserved exported protein of unknown function [Methylocella tundrae]